jgi:hypothetical protein
MRITTIFIKIVRALCLTSAMGWTFAAGGNDAETSVKVHVSGLRSDQGQYCVICSRQRSVSQQSRSLLSNGRRQ